MDKPQPLIQLLEDLRSEGSETAAETTSGSFAIIYLTAGGSPLFINREECELLLSSPEAVKQLTEAIGEPDDAAIEFHLVRVTEEVLEALEQNFAAVDEV